jgi:hypothetical protein
MHGHFGRRSLLAALLLIGSVSGWDASAQSSPRANLSRASGGATYYNRPDAGSAAHDQDLRACISMAAGIAQGVDFASGLIPALLADATDQSRLQGNVENCMVVKGWRVVQISGPEGEALGRLGRAELASRLAPWVGAQSPNGTVVRTFANEAARGDTIWGGTNYGRQNALSIKAVNLENLPEYPRFPGSTPPRTRPLKPEDFARVSADAAVVVVRMIGTRRTNGVRFDFERVRPLDAAVRPSRSATDPVETFYAAPVGPRFGGSAEERLETTIAIPVVPGRWRIAAKMNLLGFCLGAPAFDVEAGDVLFLGTFDVAGDLGPDMTLDPAQAFLANAPDLRGRLRPASWMNGVTTPCRGGHTYALEIPGAPFVDGYLAGSMAAAKGN